MEGLQGYCEKKFCDVHESSKLQAERYAKWISHQLASERDGFSAPPWPLSLTLQKRARLKASTSAGGSEDLVNEALQALPFVAVLLAHHAFASRYAGRHKEAIVTWNLVCILFMPKTRHPKEFADFRAISRLSCFSKWYTSCLVEIGNSSVPRAWKLMWSSAHCFAYEPLHNSELVSLIISDLVGKAVVWDDLDLVIAEADIASAFDSIGITEIEHVLSFWHVHPRVVAALLYELHDLSCEACLADVFTRRRILFNACIRQGGSESPWLWNAVVRYAFVKARPLWQMQDAGILLANGVVLTHIGWSDNVCGCSHVTRPRWLLWRKCLPPFSTNSVCIGSHPH